jgi:hypothetical protein
MAFVFLIAGTTWLGARFVAAFSQFESALIMLLGVESYLFISYTEKAAASDGGGHHHPAGTSSE